MCVVLVSGGPNQARRRRNETAVPTRTSRRKCPCSGHSQGSHSSCQGGSGEQPSPETGPGVPGVGRRGRESGRGWRRAAPGPKAQRGKRGLEGGHTPRKLPVATQSHTQQRSAREACPMAGAELSLAEDSAAEQEEPEAGRDVRKDRAAEGQKGGRRPAGPGCSHGTWQHLLPRPRLRPPGQNRA